MKRFIKTVQQRIGFMISVMGITAVINNIIERISIDSSISYVFSGISVWLLFLIIIPFTISIFIENRVLKSFQIIFLIITGLINIMDSYNTVYGPGLFFASWLLMRHYGFLDTYTKIKYFLFLLLLLGSTIISSIFHIQDSLYNTLEILIYTLFIVAFVIIIWRDIITEQKNLRVQNRSLKINYNRLRDQLIEQEKNHKPYNLKNVKITPAEERIIKTLTIYKASNREIAERLNIAESTVKLHLYNIYNKIGVDNRFAIIDLCKYNYT